MKARDEPGVARVPAVAGGTPRPVWSVMIPVYDCAAYLHHTLTSVLAQDPGPALMQIEVVDDASHDRPHEIVDALAPGRVSFFRQPHNVGHVRNFNTCLERARGELVHLLHGDDLALPGFYGTMQRAFETHPQIGAAFCRHTCVDDSGDTVAVASPLALSSGVLEHWLETIATGQQLQAPAMVVRRSVYEKVGGFDSRISCYGEDWEMWVRIAANYAVWYEREPLAAYRLHSRSLTARGARTGAHAADYRLVIEINRDHLPPDRADEWSRQAAMNFAAACMRRGWRSLRPGGIRTALTHFREGLRTSRAAPVLVEFLEHGRLFFVHALRRVLGMRRRSERETA